MPEDGAIWALMFEKLYAKFFGNYEAIDAGHGAIGIEVASGAPFTDVVHNKLTSLQDIETFWSRLSSKKQDKTMVTCGSYTGTGSDQDSNADGLPYNHAFSVLEAIEIVKDDGKTVRLVQIRNPWG